MARIYEIEFYYSIKIYYYVGVMDLKDTQDKMTKVVEYVKQDTATIRTGRATSALIENLVVTAYEGTTKMRILEMGQISTPDAQTIMITPYDQSTVGDIRRDIQAANMGFTPIVDNGIIRISVPALTAERRQEYVRMLHHKLEDGRVKIRQLRHDRMTEFKKAHEDGELPEDDRTRLEEELQKMTDKMMEEIEKIGENKEKELTTV